MRELAAQAKGAFSQARYSSHRVEDNSKAAKTAGLFLQSQGFVKHLTSYKHQRLLWLCLQRQTFLFFPPSNSYLLSLGSCNGEQSNHNKLGTETNKSFWGGYSRICTKLRWPWPPGLSRTQPHAPADTGRLPGETRCRTTPQGWLAQKIWARLIAQEAPDTSSLKNQGLSLFNFWIGKTLTWFKEPKYTKIYKIRVY